MELLNQNPKRELKYCSELASKYQPLAQQLFNAAFHACWVELNDIYQHECRRSLMSALKRPEKIVPAKVKQSLLDLIEFMDKQNTPLWMDIPVLGIVAEQSHSFANALYYKEKQFQMCCQSGIPVMQKSGDIISRNVSPRLKSQHSNSEMKRLSFNESLHQSYEQAFCRSYSETAESLLRVNIQLQQTEAAEGILQYTQMHEPQINIKPVLFL